LVQKQELKQLVKKVRIFYRYSSLRASNWVF